MSINQLQEEPTSSSTPVEAPGFDQISTITGTQEGPLDLDWNVLLERIKARGVVMWRNGRRLRFKPFKLVTQEEREVLKRHKPEILNRLPTVEPRAPEPVAHFVPSPPRPAIEPAPDVWPCVYCYRTPCIGVKHPAYRALHSNDPTEIARRNQEATAEMMMQIGQPSRW